MITICGLEIKSLSDAPKAIEDALRNEFRVRSLTALSPAEKIAALRRMDELGLFSVRNGVICAANMLAVSINWVYRHLKQPS